LTLLFEALGMTPDDDIDQCRVLFITEGRGADTVAELADDLEAHNGDASRIKQACIDMSPAYIKGVTDNLTEAETTFDEVPCRQARQRRRRQGPSRREQRRARVQAQPLSLAPQRALTLRGEPRQPNLQALTRLHLKTARAYQVRLAFQEIYQQVSRQWGALFLDRWHSWAIRLRLDPIKDAARTVMKHRDGILSRFDSHIANGLIEGINSLVRQQKPRPEVAARRGP
jgi:transposase